MGFFSIILTFISGFIGVLGLVVPIIVSAALVLILAELSYKVSIVYGVFIIIAAWFSYQNLIDILFFLANVAAVSIPIGLGLKKRLEFKTFMLYAISCLLVVMAAGLIYNTYLAGLNISIDNVIDNFLKPTMAAAEFFKQSSDVTTVNSMNIDAIVNMIRNMAIGIIVAIIIAEVFVTYIVVALVNRFIFSIKENIMLPVYNFKLSKVGGILYIIAAFITFFSTEGDIYMVSVNFYMIMQLPMALCGLCAVYKLINMYKLKKRTIKLIMTLLIVFAIMPVFNLMGSIAFIGAISCLLDISNINTKKSI